MSGHMAQRTEGDNTWKATERRCECQDTWHEQTEGDSTWKATERRCECQDTWHKEQKVIASLCQQREDVNVRTNGTKNRRDTGTGDKREQRGQQDR